MTKSKTNSLQTNREVVATASAPTQSEAPKRPGGKLGLIVGRLEVETGATAGELAEATVASPCNLRPRAIARPIGS
jgi:hypothetical protein